MQTTYGERLRRARAAAGLSQAELARRCQLKPQAVQYLEADENAAQGSKHSPSFARELGVSASWLATGEGPMQAGEAPPLFIATPAQIIAAFRARRPELQRAFSRILLELRDHAPSKRIALERGEVPIGGQVRRRRAA